MHITKITSVEVRITSVPIRRIGVYRNAYIIPTKINALKGPVETKLYTLISKIFEIFSSLISASNST